MGNVLNTAYNNYLVSYAPKAITRYDAHKKSELRGVYSSMLKLNKESPWYLPTTSRETQAYAINLKENARELHNTIAKLGGLEEEGLLSKRSAYSSDEETVSASYIGSPAAEEIPDFEIAVKSLASPQENMGIFLRNEKVALPSDTYSFDIAINDMNYEFQFSIGESETNRDVQERLARLINNASIGIRASIIESDPLTSLRLTSESTGIPQGKQQIFQVSDSRTSKTAGTVDYFGLDYTAKEPSNASFSVNGEEKSTSSNQFTIGKLFEIQLHGTTPEDAPVHIGLKADIDSFTDSISQLVGGYNSFVKAASSYLDTQTRSKKLIQEFKGIASVYGSSMESMGITPSDDGTLKVDADILKKTAAQTEDLAQSFDYISNFSNLLLRKSNQISLNPMDYVDKKIVAYKNPGHNFVSPYTTSAYSGMLFNGYC